MGPQDLGGYFKQQFRWALGTVGLFRSILGMLVRSPRSLRAAKWWEYLLSGTHYFVGWTFLVLWFCPVLFLFTGMPRYLARPDFFFAAFFPYIFMTLFMFMLTLRRRSYRPGEIFGGLLLTSVSFPIYIKASVLALAGVKGSFGITPKKGSVALPLSALWPQVACWALAFASVVWGLNHLYYARDGIAAVSVNLFWSSYNFVLLSTIFYFNNAEEDAPA
jgi:cellulose synthase (UDP-forming)